MYYIDQRGCVKKVNGIELAVLNNIASLGVGTCSGVTVEHIASTEADLIIEGKIRRWLLIKDTYRQVRQLKRELLILFILIRRI
jgi:hypothetical protein